MKGAGRAADLPEGFLTVHEIAPVSLLAPLHNLPAQAL